MRLCVLAFVASQALLADARPITRIAGDLHEYCRGYSGADDIADLLLVVVLIAGYYFLIHCVVHFIFL